MGAGAAIKRYLGAEEVSLKALAREAFRKFSNDDGSGIAAEIAYYFMFALFPFMLFLLTLVAYLPVEQLSDVIMGTLQDVIPGEAFNLVKTNVDAIVAERRGGILSVSIVLALWTSSSAVVAVMDGLNKAYDVRETRPFWKKRLIAILLVVGLSIVVAGSAILLIFGPKIGGMIAGMMGLGGLFEMAWNILRWPVVMAAVSLAFAVVYYFAPDTRLPWRWISIGSIAAVLGWLLASAAFSFYVDNFGSYNKTYGSVGAVIILLTWMYVSGMMILLGGEINSSLERMVTRIRDLKRRD